MTDTLARVRRRVRARGALVLAGLLGSLGAALPASAQEADSVVWVWLDDAAFASESEPALGRRALDRRARRGIALQRTDVVVPADAIAALEGAGLRVRHRSRWLRAVSGAADDATLDRIRALDFVRRVTPVRTLAAPLPDRNRDEDPAASAAAPPPEFYGVAYDQVAQIGVPFAHDLGYTGNGVVVAMLDTGFDEEHEALADLNVIARYDFIQDDSVVENEAGDPSSQDHHGTEVWSVLGGHAPDRFVGPAYGAEFLLAKVDRIGAEPRADEDRWVAALEWADSMGADVVSSSLGYVDFDDGFTWQPADYNGDITPTTIAADAAAARGILIVNSAGNEGPGQLSAPADADSIIAVGAVDENGVLASFSSTGPTADGRIKPDLVARGDEAHAASPVSPTSYIQNSGTSFAAPLVGGGAALVMEAWPALDAMQVRAALLMSGSNKIPDNAIGYGLPDIGSAILFPLGLLPQPSLANGPGGVLRTLSPTFTWDVPLLHPAAGSVRYIVQVAEDASFADIVATDTVVDAQSLVFDEPLKSGEGLWWRVLAETAAGIVRPSAPVGPFTMAPWVRLVTLNSPDGLPVNDPTPVFIWDPLPAPPPIGPLEFDVEIVGAQSASVEQLISGVTDTSFTLTQPLDFNESYLWRVITRTATGAIDTTQSIGAFIVVSVDAPPVTALYQNFPNPFPRPDAPSTRVWFDLAEASEVELAIYDLHGRLVRRLIPDARQGCTGRLALEPGIYGRDADPPCISTTWDGSTDGGERMQAGVYLIRLRTDRGSHTVRTLFRP